MPATPQRKALLGMMADVRGTTGLALAQTASTAAAALAAPTGNAQRGRVLFETTLRCYACHGFDGQTGSPRLVPMRRAEEETLACDLFLVLGSSLTVFPAAGFPLMARRNGAELVIVS